MKTSTVLMKQLVLEYFISTRQNLNIHDSLIYFQSKVQLFCKNIFSDFKRLKYLVMLFSVLLSGNVFSQKISFSESEYGLTTKKVIITKHINYLRNKLKKEIILL